MSQQINLFNPVFLKQKKIFSSVTMAQALGVLLVGSLALVAYGKLQVDALEKEARAVDAQLVQKQARQEMVNAEFAPRVPSAALEAEIAEVEGQLRSLQRVSGVLERGELGDMAGFSKYYAALARQDMSGLWLTGVSVAGADIGIRGRAMEGSMVPAYISRLTREPALQGKSFASLDIAQAELKDEGGKAVAAPFVEFRLESVVQEAAQ